MKKKRLGKLALALAAITCMSSMTASAALNHTIPPSELQPEIEIVPFWDNASQLDCDLSINGRNAACNSIIIGRSGTSRITGTLTLYRKNGSSWVAVTSWSSSSNSSILLFSENYNVSNGYNYKLVINANVYRNGTWEYISKESATILC